VDVALARAARLRLALLVASARPKAAQEHLARAGEGASAGERLRLGVVEEAVSAAVLADDGAHRDALLGRGALSAGLSALAETYLRQAVAAAPARADAQAYLALASVARGRPDAVGVVGPALALDPENEVALFAQAESLRLGGRHREAILALKSLLQTAPDDSTYLLALGEACSDYGDYEAALAYVAQAAALPGIGPEAQLAAARFHLDRAYLPERALPWAQQAHAALGDAASTLVLGGTLRLLGRHDEALSLLAQAVALDPRLAPAHYYLADVEEGRGLRESAVAHYGRAADLDPQGPFGRRARQALQSLEQKQN
ncbi:MAG: tetratricopeptide repeat protein, partial [Chloroflexota bacterium]